MKKKGLVAAAVLAFAASGLAQATETAASDVAAAQSAPPAPAESAHSGDSRIRVPKLTISWNCSKCTENEKVAPLLEQAYAREAEARGYSVSDTETAEMVVVGYHQRPPATRVLFGFMAGKDSLMVRIDYKDKQRWVNDYAANAFEGMNAVCEAVARKSFKEIVSLINGAAAAN